MPARRTSAPAPLGRGQRRINLALQGGGAHGAFTWGVLDRLLEEDKLQIEGISGASAGAMNAIALAQGLMHGGRAGAKAALADLWHKVSELHALSPVQRTPLDALLGNWNMAQTPGYVAYDMLSRVASPYQTNPLNLNPLRALIRQLVDFKAVRACADLKLFVSATNVRTGRVRVFGREELSADVLAASACLPNLFQAVRINGAYYWDGGFMGNPPLWPLIYNCESHDIVVVSINPITRNHLPRTPIEIADRVNEITFNASLMAEMRAIAFVSRQLKAGSLDANKYRHMLLHRIHNESLLDRLDAASKMNAEWSFLRRLHSAGHRTANAWLRSNWENLGKRTSFSVEDAYL